MTIRAAMKKRLVLALAVPFWIAAPVAGSAIAAEGNHRAVSPSLNL
jgi:hypothetical protein